MPENKSSFETERRNTDLAEGELDTVEDSLRTHEGKPPAAHAKKADPGQKSTDLAEGERDTVEESIRIHEQKHDRQSHA